MNARTNYRWATSFHGQVAGYLLAAAAFFFWTIVEGRTNGGYYAFGGMMALEPAAIIGALTYLAAVAKPLSDKRLHPLVFGIAFLAISILHAW